MAVARAHGKNLCFKITDSGSTLRDVSNDVDTVQGFPGGPTLGDVTAGGDTGNRFIPGLTNTVVTISGPYNSTATTGIIPILNALRTAQLGASPAPTAVQFGPEGSASGALRYTANVWVQDIKVDVQVANPVKYTATLQIDGTAAQSTF